MPDFVVLNNSESYRFIKDLYDCEVLNFMGDPRSALMNREYMDKLIRVGKDIYRDFWSVLKEEFGEVFVVEIKQKYEFYKG